MSTAENAPYENLGERDVYHIDPQSVAVREAGKTAFIACPDEYEGVLRDASGAVVGLRVALVAIDGTVTEFTVPSVPRDGR